jgi:hypothetical protein
VFTTCFDHCEDTGHGAICKEAGEADESVETGGELAAAWENDDAHTYL